VKQYPQHCHSHRARTCPELFAIARKKPLQKPIGQALRIGALVFSVAIAFTSLSFNVQAAEPAHGVAINGDLKYPENFTHFDYVNPDAPKGGQITQSRLGTYTNLNPFVLKGVAAVGAGSIYDTLTVQAADEPFSEYGLIAESIEVPDDKRWVIFRLRSEARWQKVTRFTNLTTGKCLKLKH